MEAWSQTWSALRNRALRTYQATINADPLRFRERVHAFLTALADTRARLDRIRVLLSQTDAPKLQSQASALEQRYTTLTAGLFADAPEQDQLSALPVGLVIAGTVIGVAGIAWALSAYQYAVNLREQTALLESELVARVEASRQGRPLPASTISPPPDPGREARRMGLVLLGGLTLTAAALAVPLWLRRT